MGCSNQMVSIWDPLGPSLLRLEVQSCVIYPPWKPRSAFLKLGNLSTEIDFISVDDFTGFDEAKNVALAVKLLQQWLLHVRLHVTARPAVRIPLLILLNEF